MMNNYKKVKLNEKELSTIKSIICSWICHDMRSFKIIEDSGLKDLPQDFVVLGKVTLAFIFFSTYIHYFLICLSGSKHGEFYVSSALHGADALSNHIYDVANDYHSKLNEILREPTT